MRFTSDIEVVELVNAFERQTLPKSRWTHAAHLTVALFYCCHFSFNTVVEKLRDGITRLNLVHQTPNDDPKGYHETLTVFWAATVFLFVEENQGESSLSILANVLVKQFGDTDLPLRSYSREILFSPSARREFVQPDREFGHSFYASGAG
jgi:hypothetical protein